MSNKFDYLDAALNAKTQADNEIAKSTSQILIDAIQQNNVNKIKQLIGAIGGYDVSLVSVLIELRNQMDIK